jgi:hypothetical protein
MTTRSVILTLALFSVGRVAFGARDVAAQVPEPGTYRLWLCAEACAPADSARAVATATIVILDEAAASGAPARAHFARLRSIRRTAETAPTDNVCFEVTYRQPRVGAEELYFGIQPSGATRWQYVATEGFSMRVYLSPDAGYALRWAAPGILTTGEGWSFGWAVDTPYHRNAYFAAIPTGKPDLTRCE